MRRAYTYSTTGIVITQIAIALTVAGVYYFAASGGAAVLVNQLPGLLTAELATASQVGAVPIQAGTAAFETAVNQGTIKWVVTQSGKLLITPHTVGGVEISHAVLSGGEAVLAAGHAEIAAAGGQFMGISINASSGHFGMGLVEVGLKAFAEYGIFF